MGFRFKKSRSSLREQSRGFSMVELSIGLAIVGLLASEMLDQYRIYRHVKEKTEVDARFQEVSIAIGKFVATNGRYPCPADRTLKQGDTGYGAEGNCTALYALTPGSCTTGGGICRAMGEHKPVPPAVIGSPAGVLHGMIPFVTINIPYKSALDSYGRRLSYVVSEDMTKTYPAGTNLRDYRSIRMRRQFMNSSNVMVTAPEADSKSVESPEDMLIISHGSNGKGAYTDRGILYKACAGGVEVDNCDNNGVYTDPHSQLSLVPGSAIENDDSLYRDIWTQTNYWTYSSDTGSNIYNKQMGFVGVGTEYPQDTLDVDGNVKATTIYTDRICAVDGTACFEPMKIGGSGMTCAGMITGIANGEAVCATPPVLDIIPGDCPAGEVMTGVNIDKTIRCQAP